MTEVTSSDFCIAITSEDEMWEAEALPVAVIESLDGVIGALKQLPSIGGVIGLVAVGDDFFVIVRVTGSQISLFVSDLTASVDWYDIKINDVIGLITENVIVAGCMLSNGNLAQ